MTIKILSDFDGVWTDHAEEAASIVDHMALEAARLAELSEEQARDHFAGFARAVETSAHEHGWAPDGRITVYVDEDPFCMANSIGRYIELADGDDRASHYRAAILANGDASLTEFANRCFYAAADAFREQQPPALVPGAAQALEALQALGAEVVVVSNSPSAKLVKWFGSLGVEAGEGADATLRVRGSACKHELGPEGECIQVGGRAVCVDRPRYLEAVEQEDPDLVIGDVFSLDLALPHALRRRGHPRAPRELVLRRHAHTPAWVLDDRAGGAIDRVVEHPLELVESVERLRAARL